MKVKDRAEMEHLLPFNKVKATSYSQKIPDGSILSKKLWKLLPLLPIAPHLHENVKLFWNSLFEQAETENEKSSNWD
jgi:hypothetical protein